MPQLSDKEDGLQEAERASSAILGKIAALHLLKRRWLPAFQARVTNRKMLSQGLSQLAW